MQSALATDSFPPCSSGIWLTRFPYYERLGFVVTGCHPNRVAPSYGMREFTVQDPNGYCVAFAEPGPDT